jgi:hypothetical protein
MIEITSQVPALALEDGANGRGKIDGNVFIFFLVLAKLRL